MWQGIGRNHGDQKVREAALKMGIAEAEAVMLAACGRNIYALGCIYHPDIPKRLQEVRKAEFPIFF